MPRRSGGQENHLLKPLAGFATPTLIVDLEAFEHNLTAAERMVSGTGKRLRPHVKTHRTPALALLQLGAIADGVTCATVGEAEAMVEAGVSDVLLANEIVTDGKIERMARLAQRASVGVAVDAAGPARAFASAAGRASTTIDVLVDVDIGLGRCGVRTVADALELAEFVSSQPGLRFAGIMGYEGRVRASVEQRGDRVAAAFHKLAAVADALRAAGMTVETVSAAGTSTLIEALADPVITEIQAGSYALMEHDLDGLHLPFRPAVTVLGSVISVSGTRAVVDVGRKTIGMDSGPPRAVVPEVSVVSVSEEHTVLHWGRPAPALGDRVALRPSHVRTTFNLHDNVWFARDGNVVGTAPVSARGQSQ